MARMATGSYAEAATDTAATITSATGATESTVENNAKVKALEKEKLTLADGYRKEKKSVVNISPFYKPYFGSNMPVIVNGVAVYVPVDGNSYEIPESFASVVYERIARINAQTETVNKLSNVQGNIESYAGERSLISLV